ncbi:pseudouridine-5'-phosphate glycosidase [Tuwongella immobilis]|uniref:Pseudouridine-5'-phosphate glycosidase n=1 Tax=Tuwongella immobilis TaxID=692036 RepID=A0A6C2YP88_9BACT|nr:pseudouridine-5'-phosphate glycosidase [Tuwongella immobilis]VIP03256.1 pseudouridine-5 -phosphate glycosidase : Pseudouridine-5'-phosphate glycosidase OS=Firmicutes bacterium CAG:555 GN=psuG PE=3 SV=1: Indigoidine_A [Tuwongella immobilis]VTS03856.1 pseudouridine-5 -phosphate glycosidase : Pseudouridine-5'-phosphate glycosidase OS=Firmicutes bacterium CAG:555 GN=psuG PE=3 SV=1: Indigoidine_A [Tuwongella immobilis]
MSNVVRPEISNDWLRIHPEVQQAVQTGRPVVALESTLISHGLPWPVNFETAIAAEQAIRECGVVPATIAIWHGRPTVGMDRSMIEALAQRNDVAKASRRDIGTMMALRKTAATTVAATMALAKAANISIFATGGIGGVHHAVPGEAPSDVSADLIDLGRTPILVVCAGAKNILNLPRTLEWLETEGVPVIGYRTRTFPAFYLPSSGLPVSARMDSAAEVALAFAAHRHFGGGGMLLCRPLESAFALTEPEWRNAWQSARDAAEVAGVQGAAVTPFLLKQIAEHTQGRSLAANQALIVGNARLAAETAIELARISGARTTA